MRSDAQFVSDGMSDVQKIMESFIQPTEEINIIFAIMTII